MPKEATKTKRKAATERSNEKPKGKAGKKAGAPKRALSAYMFFSQDWRERVKGENPNASFGEIGKLLGAKWKELSDAEKKPYQEQAAADKDRAESEKASFNKEKASESDGDDKDKDGDDD